MAIGLDYDYWMWIHCLILNLGLNFDILDSVSGQMKCPKCKQKGLDQEWEIKNSPADIMIAIESNKDLLFHAPSETRYEELRILMSYLWWTV